jgi:hypothetical protein
MLDKAKDMISQAGGGGDIMQQLQGINFPASKDEVVSQLQQNGAEGGMVDQVRNAATERFNGPEDVMAAVQNR